MAERAAHPEVDKNLVLVGGRGCGKSSIAKRLARANRNFMLFSLDALIRYEAGGSTITEIVEREGWAGFRERELAVVRRVSAFRNGAIIDTGGGVVVELAPDGSERKSGTKIEALRKHGWVVYLQRDAAYLAGRGRVDPNRPALPDTASPEEVMERRDPWYREAADWVLECGERSKSDLASMILERFYQAQGIVDVPADSD